MNNLKSIESKVIVQKFKQYMNLEDLPEDLHISTVTLTCCLDTEFYLENISKYVTLSNDGIVYVRYGNDESTNRSIMPITKSKSKRNKKSRKTFYNQATVLIKSKSYDN